MNNMPTGPHGYTHTFRQLMAGSLPSARPAHPHRSFPFHSPPLAIEAQHLWMDDLIAGIEPMIVITTLIKLN